MHYIIFFPSNRKITVEHYELDKKNKILKLKNVKMDTNGKKDLNTNIDLTEVKCLSIDNVKIVLR